MYITQFRMKQFAVYKYGLIKTWIEHQTSYINHNMWVGHYLQTPVKCTLGTIRSRDLLYMVSCKESTGLRCL